MKIFKIEITNFRLLKNFSMDVEKELSLIIGKNNTGKTSILSILDNFLNDRPKFSLDDFNIDFKDELKSLVEDSTDLSENDYIPLGIKLKVFIEYLPTDNLANISRVMMDLDPNNNVVVLGFEYLLSYQDYLKLKTDYKDFMLKESLKLAENSHYNQKDIFVFIRLNLDVYFKSYKKTFKYDFSSKTVNEKNYIDLDKEKIGIKDIINFKYIGARRDVTNNENNSTLSKQTSKIYKSTESVKGQDTIIEGFKDRLCETDSDLTDIYQSLFSSVIEKVKSFGGIKTNETEIKIVSELQHQELLEDNTKVVYKHDNDNFLPEYYNGLGYMNLISMIFDIEIKLKELRREKDKKPADINLLFIEEPEAHTHPQMQYVFIKNIKKLLKEGIRRDDGENRDLQYMISTHSSCIVADSEFNDIKYLKHEGGKEVISKNLKDLEKEYTDNGQENNYRFLKQYLTLNRAELFFADKAIFIEGDTERILLPSMMKKIDIANPDNPLMSQNISIVEVGNYANVFERFINFIGIKTLIITDIDSIKSQSRKSCKVSDGEATSNPSLNFFFNGIDFNQLKLLSFEQKRFKKNNDGWYSDNNGFVQIAFQTEENSYQARSFEDSFFSMNENIQFIKNNLSVFEGLKNKGYFDDSTKNPYDLAEHCIDSKGTFAIDILLCSTDDFQNWKIPAYIEEGLLWLKQDQN